MDWSLFELDWIPSGFLRPWVLWLELIPVLLLAWIWLRRSRGVPLPVDYSTHGSGAITRTLINMAESMAPLLLLSLIHI